jgi:undecaprenyl-diphosphatase
VIEFLYAVDKELFCFINQTLSTPVGDILWPYVTNYNQFLPVRVLLACIWVWLLVRGGVRGRTAALLLIPVLLIGDQLSSSVIKGLVNRPRPCQLVDGVPLLPGLHLLVDCGSGRSFPSSHAVNNFAAATLFANYYRRWAWAFFGIAAVVAISRVAVGVHFPSDAIGGALIGTSVSLAVIWVYAAIRKRYLLRRPGTMKEKGTT